MTRQRNVARGAALALALTGLLAGAPGEAQVTAGTIVGSVKDEQGAAVPGATVTITEVNKGTVGTYTTDADGSFQVPFLIPGTYDVAVELTGFRKYTHRGVVLQVNQRARVDVTLTVGGLTDSTEVVGLAPLTRTDSAELGRGDRGARDARAAPQRAQLRPARVPRPRRHSRPGRREPVRRLHLQPARRFQLQRPRLRRPTRTPGSSTASTTTSTPSTP